MHLARSVKILVIFFNLTITIKNTIKVNIQN